MDMSLYRDLFVSEARSHIVELIELIARLEGPDAGASIDELFRHAHSLKGMAATMGYGQIAQIAHLMENQMSRLRDGELHPSPPLADLLLEGSDALVRLLSGIEAGNEGGEDVTGVIGRLTAFGPATEAEPPSHAVFNRYDVENSPSTAQLRHTDSFSSIRIRTETLDHLVNITGELITNRHRLAESIRLAGASGCREPLNQLTALLRNLRDEVFNARMLPFAVITERLPRLVRDLARTLGKEIDFRLEGKDIELDRGILEAVAEPVVHLLRNAVDHGLEPPTERTMAGKPRRGTVSLTVSRARDHIEIEVADDGRGMDPERLKQHAVERGLISPEHALPMPPHEAYQLICIPGFSTSAAVTDISGRGVGMDAVRSALNAVAGVLAIHSECGRGCRFVMRLPITVSIIQALIVECGPFQIAFPLNAVVRTAELERGEIREEGGISTILSGEAPIRFRSLRETLNLPPGPGTEESLLPTVICEVGGNMVAFGADHISGQKEVFVRPLRSPLSHLRGFSGATLTGDGRVLFVADVSTLA